MIRIQLDSRKGWLARLVVRLRRRPVGVLGIAMAAILALAACTANVAGGSSSAMPDFPITPYQGQEVLGTEEIAFSDIVGKGKPVVLNFWAGLCPPCRAEMPEFQEFYDRNKDDVIVLGIDVGPFTALGSSDDGKSLLEELGITYPSGTTSEPGVVADYEIRGMPSTYFITADGELFRTWTGFLNKQVLDDITSEMMK
jgi:thiol-disulfide isomerase/thioredoxin